MTLNDVCIVNIVIITKEIGLDYCVICICIDLKGVLEYLHFLPHLPGSWRQNFIVTTTHKNENGAPEMLMAERLLVRSNFSES